jgi:GT2 family glycosyltransferase
LIYDTFIFFNELDLLEIRLNILDKYVDYFVLVEATETFQGGVKPLYFEKNKDRFLKFKHKIIHVVVDDMPARSVPFDREYHQRDCILRGLRDCRPDDLVILSDVDEIPNLERIPESVEDGMRFAFIQPLFYYKMNRKCVQMGHLPWSVLTRFRDFGLPSKLRLDLVELQSAILSNQRENAGFQLLEHGGWHFSFLGSAETIVKKIEAFSHTEYNSPEFKNVDNLLSCISQGRDLFGRDLTFVNTAIDELPSYVRDNRKLYEAMNYLESEDRGADLSALHHTHDILFDQYSRYRACAELLLRLGATSSSRILDVGSGSACLLSEFLPGFDISYVDPLINTLPTKKSNQYGYQIDEVADKLGLFDYVVAIDVLEHVPPQFRDGFTSTLASLATKSIVLAFPYEDEPSPAGVDRAVNADYAYINNSSYSWLKEHEEYGLPNAAKLKSAFAMRGLYAEYFHHGYAPWLEELLSYVINVNDIPCAKMLGHEVSREFNQKLFGYDFNQPGYRVFLVAAKVTLPEGWRPTLKPIDTHAKHMFTDMMRKAYLRLIVNLQSSDQKIADIKTEQAQAFAERDAALIDRGTAIAVRDAARAQADVLQKKNQQADALIVQMQCSKSWRLTKPLRFLGRLARYGLTKNDAQRLGNIVKPYWRMLPMPHELRQSISTRVRRFLAPAITVASVDLAKPDSLPALATNEVGKPDYFVFSVIDWHFRHQRPQQLALQIAETGRRVFYISVDFVDHAEPGFAVESLDSSGRLFNLHLHLKGAPSVYGKPPTAAQMSHLSLSMGRLLEWTQSTSVVSLIQHSFWSELAAQMPNSRLVYDCMDHHEGFGGVSDEMIAHERALLAAADLTVTTSLWLDNEVGSKTSRHVLIRNATEFEHFAKAPTGDIYKDPQGRRIIGYYGAIAEWFDVDLVGKVAQAFPDCSIVLIGADTVGAQRKLSAFTNVKFLGEIPYKQLPAYAHAFDVCLLPFKVIPLTLATNPVKAYEYLSMGKPVVSTDLPEVREMGSVCTVATEASDFVAQIKKSLDNPGTPETRQDFAQEQTWAHRAQALIAASEDTSQDPLVSIVVVTYNNLDLTKQCLASLDAYSDYANMEIIVVDNASSDGSQAWLTEWAKEAPNRKLVLNEDNRGFAAGNNQGLALATGEYLVMLNNDTHVTPGWVRTMVNHMRRNESIGLLGPVTNNIGNEARIEIFYDDMAQMLQRSASYTHVHVGQLLPLRTAAFFCVMLRREVFEKIGPLDEAFGRGFFEDDDYCRRIEQAGLSVYCAEDVFIHHHLSASFNKLRSSERQALFEQNKVTYEAKWGPWIPHQFRPPAI